MEGMGPCGCRCGWRGGESRIPKSSEQSLSHRRSLQKQHLQHLSNPCHPFPPSPSILSVFFNIHFFLQGKFKFSLFSSRFCCKNQIRTVFKNRYLQKNSQTALVIDFHVNRYVGLGGGKSKTRQFNDVMTLSSFFLCFFFLFPLKQIGQDHRTLPILLIITSQSNGLSPLPVSALTLPDHTHHPDIHLLKNHSSETKKHIYVIEKL